VGTVAHWQAEYDYDINKLEYCGKITFGVLRVYVLDTISFTLLIGSSVGNARKQFLQTFTFKRKPGQRNFRSFASY